MKDINIVLIIVGILVLLLLIFFLIKKLNNSKSNYEPVKTHTLIPIPRLPRETPTTRETPTPRETPNYDEDTFVKLRTVNYNVFGRWFNGAGYEGQNERLAAIPYAIANHPKMGKEVDIITVDEAWCPDDQFVSGGVMCGKNKSRDILIKSMTVNGWKYHTELLSEPGESPIKQQTSGGVIIFSRWPIEATSGYVFTTSFDDDKHAAKGVTYVRITKTNSKGLKQPVNVLGTHLQAWSTPDGARARVGQLSEIMNTYLPAIGIKGNGSEPLLFQGDMNTDYVQYPEEVETMFNVLNAKLPDFVKGTEHIFSSNPSSNFLVGKDGAAEQNRCLDIYKSQLNNGNGTVPSKPSAKCTNIPKTTHSGKAFNNRFTNSDGTLKVGGDSCTAYCPCCPHEMLDYILYSTEKKYLQPVYSDFEIIELNSTTPLTYDWGWCVGGGCMTNKKQSGKLTGFSLSDHYPVVANFVFKPITKTFIPPDGCKNDQDCRVKGVYCNCRGPGCTIDGKHYVSGFGKHNHKVNDNCHWRVSSATKGTCFCRPGNK